MSEAIVQKLQQWKHSPLIFATEVLGVTPSTQQADLLLNFTKGKKRKTVRSGHGTGKDAVASWLILWFMATRPYAKVVCTAPTARQLNDILWSELSKWIRYSELLQDEFVIQKDKIYHKSSPKEWWIRSVSASVKATKEEQAETLAGFHGDHLLFVVDETSGVPDPVFIPLEGAMTQEDNWILLIGNMTKDKGYFYDSHFHKEFRKDWSRFHWNSEESSNVSPEYPAYMAKKYGKESNVYKVRVLGDPPLADETTLIPLAWAQQCIGQEVDVLPDSPLYLGVDVARFGDDTSVILPRQGYRIDPWQEFSGMDTVFVAGEVNRQYAELGADGIGIDEIGVGGGVYDILFRKNLPGLFPVNVAHRSSMPEKYHRLRDELWWMVREACRAGKYSFPDILVPGEQETFGDRLANELSMPRYDYDNNGAIVVESKKAMKLRGVVSPNIADALGITEYFYNIAHKVWKKKGQRKKRTLPGASIHNRSRDARHNWMAT